MKLRWQEVPKPGLTDQTTGFRLTAAAAQNQFTFDTLWWSALIDLREWSINIFEDKARSLFPEQLHIPNDYTKDERERSLNSQIVTIFAQSPLLAAINAQPGEFGIASLHLGSIIKQEHLALDLTATSQDDDTIDVPRGTVITAVIDDGIAFANNVFRSSLLSTRVEHVSILEGTPDGDVSVGRALNKARIDKLLDECTSNMLLDEEAFYRRAGLVDFANSTFSSAALRSSHGTHIMADAAGYPMDAAPQDRPILCAILPSRVTEDVTGQNLLPSLVLALKRLKRLASRFRLPNGKKPPAVFNFSYGDFAGPHDGTSPIARVIEACFGPGSDASGDQEFRIVLPAGNGNLARIHASLGFSGHHCNKPRTLDLMTLPDDRTATFVEMWMPYSDELPGPDFVRVRVTVPNGPQSGPVDTSGGTFQVLLDENNNELARLVYEFAPPPTARGMILLSMNPTASLRASALAPAGRWKIEVTPEAIGPDQSVQVWVERDETLPGFRPGGKQAYFDDPGYQRFDELGAPLAVDPPNSDCPVQRAGTLSGFACGPSPLVIAALTQSNGLLSDYSAAGPITPQRDAPLAYRAGPDASAKADQSPVLRGVLNAGSRSGSFVRLGGTSVAAPRVARFTADSMAQGAAGDRGWLCQEAKKQDSDFPPPKPAVTRTGCGRLDIKLPGQS